MAIPLVALFAAASSSIDGNCSVMLYGIGMHGGGTPISLKESSVAACCASMWATPDAIAFTYHNSSHICDLTVGAVSPHVNSGTADATSGCRAGCPAPGSFPGPPPAAWPPAKYPTAKSVLPSTPTFGDKPPRPNIILFFGDDIGYGDLGCFGNPTSETPALDAMAATGAKLVQYYSAASICSPSRGSLMTGRNFVRIGIYPGVLSPLSFGGLPLSEVTVAKKLKSVGYRTGMCGKWHLGTNEFHPTHHGFDEYYGAPMTQCSAAD